MYVKKITSFCQVLKKMHAEENSVPFFCLKVYTHSSPPDAATAHRPPDAVRSATGGECVAMCV